MWITSVIMTSVIHDEWTSEGLNTNEQDGLGWTHKNARIAVQDKIKLSCPSQATTHTPSLPSNSPRAHRQSRLNLGDLVLQHQLDKSSREVECANEPLLKARLPKQLVMNDPTQSLDVVAAVTVPAVEFRSCNQSQLQGAINMSLMGTAQERKKLLLKLRKLLKLQYPTHKSKNPNAIFVKAREHYNKTGDLPFKIRGLEDKTDAILACIHYYAILGDTFVHVRSLGTNQFEH